MSLIQGIIFIIFFFQKNVNGIYLKSSSPVLNRILAPAPNPVFDSSRLFFNVAPGETAQLPCKVRNLGDKVVSWIRTVDLHIISYESFVFSGDARFKIIHNFEDPDSWTLQIRNVKFDDDGLYECQVNTEPKMKQAIRLTVSESKPIEPELQMKDDSAVYGTEGTMILGNKERYVKYGSRLTLTCHSRSSDFYHMKGQRPTRLVDWLQDDKIIIFDESRSGVSVDTEKDGRDLSSQLTLASVNLSDSGKYTCKPYNSQSYSISIIVVEGERTEAMQSDQANGSTQKTTTLTTMLILYFAIFC